MLSVQEEIKKLNAKLRLMQESYDLLSKNSEERDWKKVYREVAFKISFFTMDDSPTKAVCILAKLQQYLDQINADETFLGEYEAAKSQRDSLISLLRRDEDGTRR